MKYSLIIPTLNEEEYLPKLLRDISNLKYDFSDIEVVVVDGGSQDKTQGLVRTWDDNTLQPKLVVTKKKGVSFQRNTGAEVAQGTYLVFLDADTRIDKDFLINVDSTIRKHRHLIYIFESVPLEDSQIDRSLYKIFNYIVSVSQALGTPFTSGACMVIERNLFNHLGGYKVSVRHDKNEIYPEDMEILLRARKSGITAYHDRAIVVHFSLRRFQQEGRLSVVRRFIIASLEMLISGNVTSRSLQYEQGGHIYSTKKQQKKRQDMLKEVKRLMNTVKDTLTEL